MSRCKFASNCRGPVKLTWNPDDDIKFRTYRKIAASLLNTDVAVHTNVLTVANDAEAFALSVVGILPPEAQVLIFGAVAEEVGITALLRMCLCCKWMHFAIRLYMHDTLQEQACRLACSGISLLPVSMPASYVEQFTMEMRGSLAIRLIKSAFSKMALHCAAPHCALAIRAYNQSVIKDLSNPDCYPQMCHRAKMVFYTKLESTGVIRVVYHTSEQLDAALDAPVAFVASKTGSPDGPCRHTIVRVDAGKTDTVWSPHSDMAVSEVVELQGETGSILGVNWMHASHDGSALLYAVAENYNDGRYEAVKTYLWDAGSQKSYKVCFVSMVGESGMPVQPSNHGWKSLGGWFRKQYKGKVESNCLHFAVMFENEVTEVDAGGTLSFYTRHSIWQYKFCRAENTLVCHRVGLEASEMVMGRDRFDEISSDASGRWMAARVQRNHSDVRQSFGVLVDIDSHEDSVIFCCPKALLGGRYFVLSVAVTAAGEKLAMLCCSRDNVCIEVHKRISDTACVRLMHMPFTAGNAYVGPDDPGLRVLSFSPCGRFLVWRESESCSDELQGLLSVAVSEEPVDRTNKVSVSKLNTVTSNMPRSFCWRACGVWMRLRRGAVLVQS
jgi:hypothetical protein